MDNQISKHGARNVMKNTPEWAAFSFFLRLSFGAPGALRESSDAWREGGRNSVQREWYNKTGLRFAFRTHAIPTFFC